jgi:fructose-bisphosphate aldolase class II
MPIATPEVYAEMIDRAKSQGFAYPAINVTSSQTLNAALKGFADAGSDGIIQVSTGGAEYRRAPPVKNMVTGAVALAEFAHVVAAKYPVNIAMHTDHCPKDKLDTFVRPCWRSPPSASRPARTPCSSPTCGTARPCRWRRTSQIAEELLALTSANKQILEIEVGVVGGEEDGVANEINEKLYTTIEDGLAHRRGPRPGREGPLHHGPHLRQRARRVQAGRRQAAPRRPQGDPGRRRRQVRQGAPFDLVFHGGSGSSAEEIADAVDYGVIKMNVDTDTQYAFTRPVAGWMLATTTAS